MADLEVFSNLGMPSQPFFRNDRFAALANGKIYAGKADTDPTNPANQVQVYVENEDGTLTPIPQPVRTNVAGFPVWNGQVVKLITKIESSMVVTDQFDVVIFTFSNLFKYDPVQMWNLLLSQNGAKYVGTPVGNVQEQLNGYVTPWNFVGKAPYATVTAALQAMFDYASANGLDVRAEGWVGTTNGILTASNIRIFGGDWTLTGNDPRFVNCEVIGGTWRGRSMWCQNTTLRGVNGRNGHRMRHDGGDVRMFDCWYDGIPGGSNNSHINIQGVQSGGPQIWGTIEIDGCLFTNGYNGIIHQGGNAFMSRGIFRNLAFVNMQGDGIELNVVHQCFQDGCVIENILLDNIDGINPGSFASNWGLGIGVAGKGPYGWDLPDENYARNFTIRNVLVNACKQCIHVEMGRDFVIENVCVNPDVNKSVGTGITTAGIYTSGCKDFVIDGVTGEPVGNATTDVHDLRIIHMEWGPPRMSAPRNYTIRNVKTKTGRVYCPVAADPGDPTPSVNRAPHDNRVKLENIDCYKLTIFGVATQLDMFNVNFWELDAVGDDSAGGTTSSGQYIRTKSVLNMMNVNSLNPVTQAWSKCRYSNINMINCNVEARMYVNIYGSLGAMLGGVSKQFFPDLTSHGGYGNFFPCGREFDRGDLVWTYDYGSNDPKGGTNAIVGLKPYLVVEAGAYFPTGNQAKILAASVGQKSITQWLTPNGTSTGSPWLFTTMLSPGTRIVIPGAGAGGADLVTTVVRPPYQTPPSDSGAPIVVDIADPIQTAVPAETQIRMYKQIVTRPRITSGP